MKIFFPLQKFLPDGLKQLPFPSGVNHLPPWLWKVWPSKLSFSITRLGAVTCPRHSRLRRLYPHKWFSTGYTTLNHSQYMFLSGTLLHTLIRSWTRISSYQGQGLMTLMNALIQSNRGDNQRCDQDSTNESANGASLLHFSLVLNHYKNLLKRVSYV